MEKHVTQKNPLKKREERDKKENQKKNMSLRTRRIKCNDFHLLYIGKKTKIRGLCFPSSMTIKRDDQMPAFKNHSFSPICRFLIVSMT